MQGREAADGPESNLSQCETPWPLPLSNPRKLKGNQHQTWSPQMQSTECEQGQPGAYTAGLLPSLSRCSGASEFPNNENATEGCTADGGSEWLGHLPWL